MVKGPTNLSETDLSSYRNKHWVVELAPGVSVDDALEPEFWAHVGKRLRPYNRIELQAQDMTFVADCIVLAAGQGFARLKLLTLHSLAESAESAAEMMNATAIEDLYAVKWNGPSQKWIVLRKSDDMPLQTGFPAKADAEVWALGHRRTVST